MRKIGIFFIVLMRSSELPMALTCETKKLYIDCMLLVCYIDSFVIYLNLLQNFRSKYNF